MNTRELIDEVSELVGAEKFLEAERLLLSARRQADEGGDIQERLLVISELIELYCVAEPDNLPEAEKLSLEREALSGDAGTRLQTATLFSYVLQNDERTVQKAREAIELGTAQDDSITVYTSLSVLGQSLLKLGRVPEAILALDEIGAMVEAKRRIIVGDETAFLEALQEQHLGGGRVAKIASTLVPRCRNEVFKRRLESLVTES